MLGGAAVETGSTLVPLSSRNQPYETLPTPDHSGMKPLR